MVSNSLHMELSELIEALTRIRDEDGQDSDYLEGRATLPGDWPM